MSQDTLKSVYYSYFHTFISYGKIFWVILQTVFMSFDFKRGQLESLLGQDQGIPVQNCLRNGGYYHYSLSILSFLLFVVNNENLFHVNSEIHGFNTRQSSNLHQPQANLSLYQKGAYYSGIKVFKNLPSNIKKIIFNSPKS